MHRPPRRIDSARERVVVVARRRRRDPPSHPRQRERAGAASTSPATARSCSTTPPPIAAIRPSARLFVESEYLAAEHALLFRRAPRDARRAAAVPAPHAGAAAHRRPPRSATTALARALPRPRRHRRARRRRWPSTRRGSRGTQRQRRSIRSWRSPPSVESAAARRRELAFVTLVADTRDAALELAAPLPLARELEWTFELARQRAEDELATPRPRCRRSADAERACSRCCSIRIRRLRAPPDLLERNTAGRSALWRFGISGDLPILLVRVCRRPRHAASCATSCARRLLARPRRRRRPRRASTSTPAATAPSSTIGSCRAVADAGAEGWIHRPGGVFLVQADQIGDAERTAAARAAARVVLDAAGGPLARAGRAGSPPRPPLCRRWCRPRRTSIAAATVAAAPTDLALRQRPRRLLAPTGASTSSTSSRASATPAPWVNVIANRRFGFVVSEAGRRLHLGARTAARTA